MEVMRSYTTGLSLADYSLNERGSLKKSLAAIVRQLSDENTQHCQQHSHQVVNFLTGLEIKKHNISDPFPTPQTGGSTGKYAVNALMSEIGDASNHLHSSYHQLHTASKGFMDRIEKVQEIFAWMDLHPDEFVKWILWKRSVYTLSHFTNKWKVSFWYLDSMMRGVHAKYFDHKNKMLPCFLRKVSEKEFLDAIEQVKSSFDLEETLTERQEAFVKRLDKLKKKKLDLAFIPSGWKYFKLWMETENLPRNWMSAIMTILTQVYLLDYKRLIEEIQTAKVTELLKIPFQKKQNKQNKQEKHNTNLPYLMVSGPKYVIRRENNAKSLEHMRRQGYFELKFKFLQDKWKDAITVQVKASRKIRGFIDKDIELRSMVVLYPRSNIVDIQLIFSGKIEAFLATDHLKCDDKVGVEKVDTIGIDINRRGVFAIVSNLELEMPSGLLEQSRRWDKALESIGYLQSLQDKTSNLWKKRVYQFQLESLYRRKKNLRKDYHLRLANWVGQQLVWSNANKLVIEDLDVGTYGTRGALAKAIESMADDALLYIREVLAVREFTGRNIGLQKVSPYNSSSIHLDCGGRLQRQGKNYDIAPCNRCNEMVNTHKNAAIYLVRSTKS